MANVLEIPSNTGVDGSTLEIPQVFGTNPAVVYTASNGQLRQYGGVLDATDDGFVYTGTTCGDDFNEVLAIHDNVTGWWAVIQHADYFHMPDPSGEATIEATNAANSGPTLGQLFPAWALSLAELDPATPAEIDGWALFCDGDIQLQIIPFSLCPIGGPLFASCPKGPPHCPRGTAINAGGTCEKIDPPVPAPLHNQAGGDFSLNPTRMFGPPLPLASDGNGFARSTATMPLPVHPVLARATVEAVCGACQSAALYENDEEYEV